MSNMNKLIRLGIVGCGHVAESWHLMEGSVVIEPEHYQELEQQKGGKFKPVRLLIKQEESV